MEYITLAHGSGGKLMHRLIKEKFLRYFKNDILEELKDSGIVDIKNIKLAFTTDSYVVNPVFFPGGDIGKLAVCGTVNDLAVVGAKPVFLSISFILEEGFPVSFLEKILTSIKKTALEAKVKIVTGDTKVVEKGNCDKIFINTSGIGILYKNYPKKKPKKGDKIIVSGYLGDHEISVLSKREGIELETEIKSDCAPLNFLVEDILKVSENVVFIRDITRGGLSTVLNEFVQEYGVGVYIEESKIPVRKEVIAACEILGFDPLYLANEGKILVIVRDKDTENVVKIMKKNKYGKNSVIIGEVIEEENKVLLKTQIGGTRIVDMLVGEQLPRIC